MTGPRIHIAIQPVIIEAVKLNIEAVQLKS
jgi:hypothetical protein